MKIKNREIKGFKQAVSATKKLGGYNFYNNTIAIYLDTVENRLYCYEFTDDRSFVQEENMVCIMQTKCATTMEELRRRITRTLIHLEKTDNNF